MAKRPRILLIGASGYGSVYLNELLQNDTGADLVGICDISPGISAGAIPVYQSLDAFYAADSADLAIIVTPVHYHVGMVLFCLQNGSNVLCEKPLCLTLEEATRMQDAAKAAGKFLSLGYQLNYRRDVLALKKDILAGRFGKPKRFSILHCSKRGAAYYARNNWAGRITLNGREVFDSPFTNSNAHQFQMMTFLLGANMHSACEIKSLEADLYHGNPDVENYDIAALRFQTAENVALCYYTAHTIVENLGPIGVFEFENGRVTFNSEESSFLAKMNDGTSFRYSDITPFGGMQKLYDAIDCVKNGGAPLCGAEADKAHIKAVRMVQALPIQNVREALRRYEMANGDTFIHIDGLKDIFEKSAQKWALPSEIGLGLM
jgi:Predicted dehydrogenases and related proteins